MEPPNRGQVGAWALVYYSGVVLYWGGFVKKPFLCVVSIIIIHTLSVQITMVSLGADIDLLCSPSRSGVYVYRREKLDGA